METQQHVPDIHFNITTMFIDKKHDFLPDSEGYYTLPVGALGAKNRSGFVYDIDTHVEALTGSKSFIKMLIEEGNCYGEISHPLELELTRQEIIYEPMHSHHIRRVKTGPKLPSGAVLILCEIKPHGKYGKQLEDSIRDPNMNTAFSMRSISDQVINKITKQVTRYLKKIWTYDHAFAPGIKAASKYSLVSNECFTSLDMSVTMSDFFTPSGEVRSYESITHHDLSDMFGIKELHLKTERLLKVPGKAGILNADGTPASLLHHALSR